MEFLIIALILVTIFFVIKSQNKKSTIQNSQSAATKEIQLIDTSDHINPELAKLKDSFKFEFLVRQWRTSEILASVNDKLMLYPEPTNSYDKNAVAVFNQDGFFGYIAQEENSGLSKYLINNGHYFSKVHWTNEDEAKRYLIDFYSTRFIGKSHNVLRNPELKKKSANLKKKFKFKNITDENRRTWLTYFEELEFKVDDQDDNISDDLTNMINDLVFCLEEEPNSETSEELFDLAVDYLPETEILLGSGELSKENERVTKNFKIKLEEILKTISE